MKPISANHTGKKRKDKRLEQTGCEKHSNSKGNDNPHEKSTVDYAEWNDGWDEAAFYGGYGFYDIHEVANDVIQGPRSGPAGMEG